MLPKGALYYKKSRNGDTLGPVELNVWLEQGDQGDQGDRREQDDQGEVSIIIFGMSASSGFQKYSISWVFQAQTARRYCPGARFSVFLFYSFCRFSYFSA